jgi:hypothetical protein
MNRFVRATPGWVWVQHASRGDTISQWARRLPIGLGVPLLFAVSAAMAGPPDLAPSAVTQLQQLGVEKQSRTPAQRKVDSQLLYSSRVAAGTASVYGSAPLMPSIAVALAHR